VAAISAGDAEIGDVIADAIEKVGKDGVVNVEEGQTFGMDLEFTEGMQFDKGYISPYMVTDQERMEAVLEDPYVLIANSKIGSVRDLLPVLEQVIQSGKALLIIAEDVEGEALATLVVNKLRGTFTGVASRRRASAIAASGCSRTSRSSPAARSSPRRWASSSRTPSSRSSAARRRVVLAKDTTTLIDGAGEADAIKGRINQIKTEIENTDSDFDREKLQERLAKLRRRRRREGRRGHRDRDEGEEAPRRGRAAGHPRGARGGHRAGRRRGAARGADGDRPRRSPTRTRRPARKIVLRALEEPLRQIAENAGLEGSVVVNDVRKAAKGHGLNAETGEIVDLVAAGVIDPAMVTRSALQNAASIAKNILTTEAIVAEMPTRTAAVAAACPTMAE
jgi:chaperonin GroEL